MTTDIRSRLPSRIRSTGTASIVPECVDASARKLLHEIRDMLFVVAGATARQQGGIDANAAAMLDRVADVARQASDRARALAEFLEVPPDIDTTMSFDANARLRALQPLLAADLPAGSELRMLLAADLWRTPGDPVRFEDAIKTLMRAAGDAMRRQSFAAPVAILTSNRPGALPDGQVRVSIVSDIAWMSDDPSFIRSLRGVESDLAHCAGRLLLSDRPNCYAAAHISLRRSWSTLGISVSRDHCSTTGP